MTKFPEGNAIVYCQGAFGTSNGKTAHGLVRRTARYRILSVIDSRFARQDAGSVLDGVHKNIPILADIKEALIASLEAGSPATHLVIGLAPDGGRLSGEARLDIAGAIELGLNVDSGLHDFLSEDTYLGDLAQKHNVVIRDIRKIPPREQQHFFTGKIDQVQSIKVAVLGTDSAVGKRTTAWSLVDALKKVGHSAEMIGTGQTTWMQGVEYSIILDSIINDFLTGEIEHVVWSAWNDKKPEFIIIEGQGGLLNPAYPGGYEIIAAARPEMILIQHAPARKYYDGFPNYEIQPLPVHIQAAEIISGRPVVAVAVNHENIPRSRVRRVCSQVSSLTGLPAFDVLYDGADGLAAVVASKAVKRPIEVVPNPDRKMRQ